MKKLVVGFLIVTMFSAVSTLANENRVETQSGMENYYQNQQRANRRVANSITQSHQNQQRANRRVANSITQSHQNQQRANRRVANSITQSHQNQQRANRRVANSITQSHQNQQRANRRVANSITQSHQNQQRANRRVANSITQSHQNQQRANRRVANSITQSHQNQQRANRRVANSITQSHQNQQRANRRVANSITQSHQNQQRANRRVANSITQSHQNQQRANRRVANSITQITPPLLLHDIIDQPAHHMSGLDWKLFYNYVSTFSDSAFLDFQDENGNTALHLALTNINYRAARTLVEAGADPTLPNNYDLTALDIAKVIMAVTADDNIFSRTIRDIPLFSPAFLQEMSRLNPSYIHNILEDLTIKQ